MQIGPIYLWYLTTRNGPELRAITNVFPTRDQVGFQPWWKKGDRRGQSCTSVLSSLNSLTARLSLFGWLISSLFNRERKSLLSSCIAEKCPWKIADPKHVMLFPIVPGKSSLFHLFFLWRFFSVVPLKGILLVPKMCECGRGTGLLQLQVFELTCSDLFSFPVSSQRQFQTTSVYEQLTGMLKECTQSPQDWFMFSALCLCFRQSKRNLLRFFSKIEIYLLSFVLNDLKLYWISFRSWYHNSKFLVSFRAHFLFAVSTAIVHVFFATHRLFIQCLYTWTELFNTTFKNLHSN